MTPANNLPARLRHLTNNANTISTQLPALLARMREQQPDGYPATTPGNGTAPTAPTGAITDPTARAVLARTAGPPLYDIDGTPLARTRADDPDTLTRRALIAINELEDLATFVANHPLSRTHRNGQRCAGVADPTCQHWAATHRHADGTSDDRHCDTCWPILCQHCRDRVPQVGRHIGGVPSCEACYRRARR